MSARVALVTGASRGLGRAIATELGVSGCDVAVTYEQRADLASEVVASIVAAGRKSFATQLDVVDGRAVDGVIQQVIAEFGRLDVLVCNAGIFSRSLIVDTTDEEFTRTFDVNVRGVFNCLRAALPVMYEQREWPDHHDQLPQREARHRGQLEGDLCSDQECGRVVHERGCGRGGALRGDRELRLTWMDAAIRPGP